MEVLLCPLASLPLSSALGTGYLPGLAGSGRSAVPTLRTTTSGQCFSTLAAPEPPEDFVKIPIPRPQPQGNESGVSEGGARETVVLRPGLPLTQASPCARVQCSGVLELSVTTGGRGVGWGLGLCKPFLLEDGLASLPGSADPMVSAAESSSFCLFQSF